MTKPPGEYGEKLTYLQVAALLDEVEDTELIWSHIHFIATMFAESNFWTWIRPVVWDPDAKHHLSLDRGICQINSYWFPDCTDAIAFDPKENIRYAVGVIKFWVDQGYRDARPWKWSPILDWLWHGYGTANYEKALGPARQAVNQIRAEQGLDPI